MAKYKAQTRVVIESVTKFKALHSLEPWSFILKDNSAIIEAYVMAKGDWETIAEVKASGFVDAEETATYITKAVNNYEQNNKLIDELLSALELCLASKLNWEAEQEAELVVRRAKEKK